MIGSVVEDVETVIGASSFAAFALELTMASTMRGVLQFTAADG